MPRSLLLLLRSVCLMQAKASKWGISTEGIWASQSSLIKFGSVASTPADTCGSHQGLDGCSTTAFSYSKTQYLCAEGGGGFTNRLKAYFDYHQAAPTSANIEIISASVNLLEPGAQSALVTAIRDAAQRIGDIALIVVDTLNRTMVGGDENSAADMSAYVGNVTSVCESIGAFGMVIHHCGKDTSRGARGHSSLRASADLELEVSRNDNGGGTLRVSKARDGVEGAQYGFRLDSVDLRVDADGDLPASETFLLAPQCDGTDPELRKNLEWKIDNWSYDFTGTRFGKSTSVWSTFLELKRLRDERFQHQKSVASGISRKELLSLLNKFKHGIAGLLYELHVHFGQRCPAKIIRHAHYPEIEIVK